MQQNTAPIIVTLKLNPKAELFFNEMRTKYFPAYCNYVSAHVTLFNRVNCSIEILHNLLEKYKKPTILNMEINGLVNMGKGLAYTVQSAELLKLQKEIKQPLKTYLGLKDKKKYWPHITIQNKVTAFKALQTHTSLLETFTPFTAEAIGFTTWKFQKNKWIYLQDFLFEEAVY